MTVEPAFGQEPVPDIEPSSMVVELETGDRAHYLDWGGPEGGLPPLLLVHGLSQTAWSWAPIARRLRGRTHVVSLDLRGHGLSDAPREGYELESLAYDMLAVCSALGWGADVGGRSMVLAGHGFGAQVVATAAALRPASIAGVALVDGGWEDLAEATGLDPDEFVRGAEEPPEVMRSMRAYLADRREYDPASWDRDQERAARAAVSEKHAGHVVPVARPHVIRAVVHAMFDYRPRDVLASIAAPLLVAVAESGSADDETVRERRLALGDVVRERTLAGLAEPRTVRYLGAGHNLMRYRPDALAAELLDFLRDVAATSGRMPDGPA